MSNFINSIYSVLILGIIGVLMGVDMIRSRNKSKNLQKMPYSYSGISWVRGLSCVFIGLICLYYSIKEIFFK